MLRIVSGTKPFYIYVLLGFYPHEYFPSEEAQNIFKVFPLVNTFQLFKMAKPLTAEHILTRTKAENLE